MCGFVRRVTDSPHVKSLLAILGIDNLVLEGGDYRPRGVLSGVIIEDEGVYSSIDAIWWYLLKKEDGQWKPNPQYSTYNAHKLGSQTWKGAVKSRRALVIADAIGESHPVPGFKTKKQHYLMEGTVGLALGALYQEWPGDDGPTYSVAIVTTEPHPEFARYHEKSLPCFIPPDATLMKDWLSKKVEHPAGLEGERMISRLPYDLNVSEVKTFIRGEQVAGPWPLSADWGVEAPR